MAIGEILILILSLCVALLVPALLITIIVLLRRNAKALQNMQSRDAQPPAVPPSQDGGTRPPA